ncbi:hypothetical protein ACN47E_000861 [Coniothyrium glycines]
METFQRALKRITSTDCACPTCATRVTPTVAIAVNSTSRPYTPAQASRDSDTLFALATALWDADPYYGCDLIRRLVDLCAEVTVYGRARGSARLFRRRQGAALAGTRVAATASPSAEAAQVDRGARRLAVRRPRGCRHGGDP